MSQLKPSPWKAPQASLPIALLVAAVVTQAAAAPPRDESQPIPMELTPAPLIT